MKDQQLTKETTYKQDNAKRFVLSSRIKTLEAIQLIEKDSDKWLRREELIEDLEYQIECINSFAKINNRYSRNQNVKP